MSNIRAATMEDATRLAEIEIFNYRLNFYPIFQSDWYYFKELQVPKLMEKYQSDNNLLDRTFVYDDGVVKGFIRIAGTEVEKLFVEPVLQGQGIGAQLLDYATEEKKLEEDTTEYLVRMER